MDKNIEKEVKVIKNENGNDKLTIDDRIAIKELEDKIASMKADKEKKCKAAKEQLIEMLSVTVDKYRTVTGTAEALRIVQFLNQDNLGYDLTWANKLAWDLAVEADRMREKAESLNYAEMDQICDGFYEKEFKLDSPKVYDVAFEMMRIDLCRNVGGAAEDMVEFIKRVEEEIDACGEKLKELKAKEVK